MIMGSTKSCCLSLWPEKSNEIHTIFQVVLDLRPSHLDHNQPVGQRVKLTWQQFLESISPSEIQGERKDVLKKHGYIVAQRVELMQQSLLKATRPSKCEGENTMYEKTVYEKSKVTD
jgi:hypothetical protein